MNFDKESKFFFFFLVVTVGGRGGAETITVCQKPNAVKYKQEDHEALNRSPEYAGQDQTIDFESG